MAWRPHGGMLRSKRADGLVVAPMFSRFRSVIRSFRGLMSPTTSHAVDSPRENLTLVGCRRSNTSPGISQAHVPQRRGNSGESATALTEGEQPARWMRAQISQVPRTERGGSHRVQLDEVGREPWRDPCPSTYLVLVDSVNDTSARQMPMCGRCWRSSVGIPPTRSSTTRFRRQSAHAVP